MEKQKVNCSKGLAASGSLQFKMFLVIENNLYFKFFI